MSEWKWKKGWLYGPTITHVKASGAEKMPGCCAKDNFRRVTFHNEGVSRQCQPGHVESLARYVRDQRIWYTFLFCDRCPEIAQVCQTGRAARAMKGGSVCPAGNSANRHGKFNIQVCLAGRGSDKTKPFAEWPDEVKTFLRKLHNKCEIPAKAMPWDKAVRSAEKWRNPAKGYAFHSHGPTDDHTDCLEQKWSFKKYKQNILGL